MRYAGTQPEFVMAKGNLYDFEVRGHLAAKLGRTRIKYLLSLPQQRLEWERATATLSLLPDHNCRTTIVDLSSL